MSAGDLRSIPLARWFAGGKIDQRKFHGYLLDPAHHDGKHKLRLWVAVFGIGEGDGPLLEQLIRAQIVRGIFMEKPPRDDLRRFEVIIPDFISPKNDNTGEVITGWVSMPDDPIQEVKPRLVTAFPVVP